jgi:hypothetical protein
MARRRKFNPSQKRDFHGRWTAGSPASGASRISRSAGGVVRSSTGNTRRYDAYLAQQAAQKQAARRSAVKKVVLGAAIVGAAGAGAYVGSRGKSKSTKDSPLGSVSHLPIKKEIVKVPIVGRSSTPKRLETTASTPRTVSSSPVVARAINGTEIKRQRPVAKANPTSSPVQAPVTHGVSTIKAEAARVSLKRTGPKPKSNPAGNPISTPGLLVTEDGKRVKVVKGLADKERIEIERRAVAAASKLAALEKKAGVNAGSQARRDFDKKNAAKRTKSQAARDRKDKQAAARRDEMSKAIRDSFGSQAVLKGSGSRRDRAEARYATILENMMESGTSLNRKQRTFLKDYL